MSSKIKFKKFSPTLINQFQMALKLFISSLFIALLSSSQAHAEDLVWNSVLANGSGDGTPCRLNPDDPSRDNVYWSAAGGDLSLVLTSWGLSLPKLVRFTGKHRRQ